VSEPILEPFIVNGSTSAVIIAPGGGYHDLAWDKEGLDVARLYNSFGVSAFVLKYRVPARQPLSGLPKWWAPLQDAQRAVGLIRAAAKRGEWGSLRPDAIGFTGFSAGGHLTAHISSSWSTRYYPRVDGSDDESCRPDFSVLMYPWSLLPLNKPVPWGAPYALADEFASTVTGSDPPSLFIHNQDDPTAPVQGSLAYFTKLQAVKAAPPALHAFPSGGHGFGLCQTFSQYEEVCDWPKVAQRFLQDRGYAPGWPQKNITASAMTQQNCLPHDDDAQGAGAMWLEDDERSAQVTRGIQVESS